MFDLQTKIRVHLEKGQENDAIKLIYASVFPKIKNYVVRNGGKLEDAQDIFQEAVTIFYKQFKLNKIDHTRDIYGYIFIIARNSWYRMAGSKHKINNVPLNEHHDLVDNKNSETQTINTEKLIFINDLLGKIGDQCKKLLLSSIFYKKNMQEIAVEMGFANENVAKSTNYRCKQKLLELVEGKENQIRNMLSYD